MSVYKELVRTYIQHPEPDIRLEQLSWSINVLSSADDCGRLGAIGGLYFPWFPRDIDDAMFSILTCVVQLAVGYL